MILIQLQANHDLKCVFITCNESCNKSLDYLNFLETNSRVAVLKKKIIKKYFISREYFNQEEKFLHKAYELAEKLNYKFLNLFRTSNISSCKCKSCMTNKFGMVVTKVNIALNEK